jgi:hypothetical protein
MSMTRAVAAFAVLAFAGFAVAQAPPPPPPPPGKAPPATAAPPAKAGEAVQAYRVKQVLGSKVNIQGNVAIGTVDDLVFNDQGEVEYLIVANEGKMVTVPWEAAKFNFEKQSATINITQEQFRTIPTYTTTSYPVYFEPTYRTTVYRYYGLTPRPFRARFR